MLNQELGKEDLEPRYELFSLYIGFNCTGLPGQKSVVSAYQQWVTQVRFVYLYLHTPDHRASSVDVIQKSLGRWGGMEGLQTIPSHSVEKKPENNPIKQSFQKMKKKN